MMYPTFFVNAFSSEYFRGNTAAVVILENYPPEVKMQALAKEFGFSETVYLCPAGKGKYQIRWFTPEVEVALCGHGTLAAAKVLFSFIDPEAEKLHFESLSGELTAQKTGELIELNFPMDEPKVIVAAPALIEALGSYPPQEILYAPHTQNLIVVYPTAEMVLALKPDFKQLVQLPHQDIFGIAVTAQGESPIDYICRYFAPWEGINEDPVTGSAQTYLAPYWAKRMQKQVLQGIQASARRGAFQVQIVGKRILIRGEAFVYLRGKISAGWQ